LLGIDNIIIPATNLAKTVADNSIAFEYLHGMQGPAVRVRIAPLVFQRFEDLKFNTINAESSAELIYFIFVGYLLLQSN